MLRQMLVCYESILTAESSAFLFRNGCRVSGNWGTSRLSPHFRPRIFPSLKNWRTSRLSPYFPTSIPPYFAFHA